MHRAESILSAIETTLNGLTTTGANVARARVYAVDSFPSLSIYKGNDLAAESDEMLDPLMRNLFFDVEIHINQSGNPETHLNAIAAEVYAALNLDYTLGLGYVFSCEIVGDDAPEIEGAQDLPVARMRSAWRVIYEHSTESAEA
jgi:hypothetical protein